MSLLEAEDFRQLVWIDLTAELTVAGGLRVSE
jgi:hypothetical protein